MWKVDAGALDQVNFRELYHQFLLVEDIDEKTRTLIRKSEFKMLPDDNAMLVFGYIDREAGMSFELLAAAHVYEDGKVSLEPRSETTSCKFRWGSLVGKVSQFTDKSRLIPYMEWANGIVEWYGCSNDVKEIREMTELDGLRAPGYPDDIVVYFFKKDCRPEGIWCRAESIDRERHLFMMKMLNEPFTPFGKHMGNIVPVQTIRMDDGSIKAFALLDMEED